MNFPVSEKVLENLGFRSEALPGLYGYLELLWSSNEELNLISRKMTPQELVDNHVVDCLLPLKYFPEKVNAVADFGTGGGLPAVLYALQFPSLPFHLFEKSPKKQIFLKECQKICPNLLVVGEIPHDLPEAVDLVTARAFKPVDVILQLSRNYAKNKGRYFLLKGRKEKIDEELRDSQKIIKDLKVEITALQSPLVEAERHLVTINI